MQKYFMEVLIGVSIIIIAGTIAIVGNDHSTIIVHGERLEEVKSLKAAVNDLRQSNTDIKTSVAKIEGNVERLDEKIRDIKIILERTR